MASFTRLAPYTFDRGTAVVTGAARGIGEHLARQLANRGSHLALMDLRAEQLTILIDELRAEHPDLVISGHVGDLAEPEAVADMRHDVLSAHGTVTLVINNAGVGLVGAFDQVSADDFDWLMQINLHAPIAVTRAFLPELTARPGSHIVYVSSLFGLVAAPGHTAYATSKFGVLGFAQALRQELVERQVGVSSVHPAGVATRIAADARVGAGISEHDARVGQEAFSHLMTMDPARAATSILRGTRRRRSRIVIGGAAVALDVLERFAPGAGGRVLRVALHRQVGQQSISRTIPTLRKVVRTCDSGAQAAKKDSTPRGSPLIDRAANDPLEAAGAVVGGRRTDGVRRVKAAGTEVRVCITEPRGDSKGVALLLHGIGRSLEDWNEQHRLLNASHRVISMDLPGFGYTPRARGGMGLPALAEAVIATLDALDESAPVHLVASSYGGGVAMYVLVRHCDRVRTLTLANSVGFCRQVTMNLRLLAVPVLGKRLLTNPTRERIRGIERSMYADSSMADDLRTDRALALSRVPGRGLAYREAIREVGGTRGIDEGWRRELLQSLRAPVVPTLIIWGDKDAILPPSSLEVAGRAFPHARTVMLPDTGHLPQIERPDAFAALVHQLWEGDGPDHTPIVDVSMTNR